MKLNLGCSDTAIPGFMGVDICEPADIVADLSLAWPWPDSSIEEVRAHHIFEHLPDRVHTMNELYRVLRPGGWATIEVPSAVHGSGFAQDPTHRSPWAMNSFQYFEAGSFAQQRLAKSYGITARFQVVSIAEAMYQDRYEQVWNITAVLVALK